MQIKCLICHSVDCKKIYKDYPGYIEGTSFDIYKCDSCGSHFVIAEENSKKLYEFIYSSPNTSGYERYYKYAAKVKTKTNPLKYLAYNEPTYYPIFYYLKDKKAINILEVGCGYGYLSYSLNNNGFTVTALDISSEAINFARKYFGEYFLKMDIKEYASGTENKFDLIIASEVIEHLNDPSDFLRDCISLLVDKGKIILTTPDKDYFEKNAIWQSDLPPVHHFWIGRKGVMILAKKNGLMASFTDFSNYYSKYENRMAKYFRLRKDIIASSVLSKEGVPLSRSLSRMHKVISFFVHKIPFVRFLSNYLYNLINGTENTLGIILEKINIE